jgi:hypothetical protein
MLFYFSAVSLLEAKKQFKIFSKINLTTQFFASKIISIIRSNLCFIEPKYKIINVKHHRRMKRSNNEDEKNVVDSIINIRLSDVKGEFFQNFFHSSKLLSMKYILQMITYNLNSRDLKI